MELVGRIDGILTDNGTDYHPILRCALTEAAACIREMVEREERRIEAAFMWAWSRGSGTFLQDPDGLAEWRAYRRSALRALPPAPGAEA